MEKGSTLLVLKERGGAFRYRNEVIIKIFKEALFSSSGCLLSEATEKIIFYINSFDYHLKPQLPDNEKEAENESL